MELYPNNLKIWKFGKEAPQNFDSEKATIAEWQGASESQNSEEKPTLPKNTFSSCLGMPRVGVGVALIRDQKVLVGRRKGAHGAGDWSLAGGHLEFGETIETCAIRELAEETGVKAHSVHLGPWTNNIIDGNKHYVTIFVFVNQFEGEPRLMEPNKCEGWKWFGWDELPTPIFPSVRSLIEKVGIEQLKRII